MGNRSTANILDWATRISALVPTWVWSTTVTTLSTVLGVVQSLPYQAILLIAVWTLGGAVFAVLAIKEAITTASAARSRRELLLRSLSGFVDKYERIERECRASAGTDAFNKTQTSAFVEIHRFLSTEMPDGYAGQFKAQSAEPLDVPTEFNSEQRYMLFQVHGRKKWLSDVIDEIRKQ